MKSDRPEELSVKAKLMRNNIRRWWRDPVAFVRENFGVEPDEWQKDFLINFVTHQRSGAKACKGPGKTAALAWCAWLFLICMSQAKVVATSMTGDNLRDGLWSEMAKWQKKSPILSAMFTWTKTRIAHNEHPEDWFMSARQWSKGASPEAQADSLAGLHADNICFMIDEAGSVPDAVAAAAEAALANEGAEVGGGGFARFVICGNPNMLEGPLYRACSSEADLWAMIEITGDPDDPKRSPRISKQWAADQIKKYGRDNPWVMINVFGKFPPSSVNALLGPDDMEAAMKRVVPREAYVHAPKVLGVDVARQGDDATIIYPRQGMVAFTPKVIRIPNVQQIAGQVAQAIKKFQPDAVFIDATGGYGWGVIDALRAWGYEVEGVEFAGKALSMQYVNKRAEMAFECAQWVKNGGCLPRDDLLKAEGCAMTYFFKKDQIQITEKDQIKELLGRSPDHYDALALTFAFPVNKKNHIDQFRVKMTSDFDPLIDYKSRSQDDFVDDYDPLR